MMLKTVFGKSAMVLAIALVALGGCTTNKRGGSVPYDVKDFGPPQAPVITPEAARYLIAPGDTLNVFVYQVPDLTRVVEVDAKGGFDYPPLGRVEANGRTPEDLKTELTTRLGEKYLQSPSVEVTLKATVSNQVTVDGAVTAPGLYPIAPGTTLMQAVAIARGTTATANLRRVVVFRRVNGQRMAAAFDLLDIRRGQMSDPEVYARDVIVVDGSNVNTQWTQALSAIGLVSIFKPF
jgi:polysaccharide biosynthesis/export protein